MYSLPHRGALRGLLQYNQALGGRAHVRVIVVGRTLKRLLLELKKLAKSPLPGGGFRWYGVFNIREVAGGGIVRLRLNQTAGPEAAPQSRGTPARDRQRREGRRSPFMDAERTRSRGTSS